MIAINPNPDNNTSSGPVTPSLASSNNLPVNSKFAGVQWIDPKPATNLPKDKAGKMRVRASKIVNSELFSGLPKIFSIFGVGYSLFSLMQIGEKGFKDTAKKMIAPLLIAAASLGFDYSIRPWMKDFTEIPVPTPKVDLEKDLCWDKKDFNLFLRTLKLFMGDTTNYLGDVNSTQSQELHGTKRDGLLILAGPPGNGKTAMAYGIGNLANKPIHSIKVSQSGFSSAIEEAFATAKKKNAILFIDEADAIIRSRNDKTTQAFLETFNRYQRENPVRVILATNSYSDMDNAIQSRAYVFSLGNPAVDLKKDIFKKKLLEQGLKSIAYENLLTKDLKALQDLLAKYDLSGRDIESVVQDLKVIAEMRISQQMIDKHSTNLKAEEVLGSNEVCIKLSDVEQTLKEFGEMKKRAKKESISASAGADFLKALAG